MATSGATLATLTPGDVEIPNGGQVALYKYSLNANTQYGGIDCLRFQGQGVGQGTISAALWDFILLRAAAASSGYTGTTGIQLKIHWFAPKQSQAVVWAASFQLNGLTDLPAPGTENFPAGGSANEVSATAPCNVITAGGLVVTTINIPLAKIQNGQVTAPAQGDSVRLRLRRALDNAADTLTDYCYVTMVEAIDY
jgi:hypothetical protein